MPLYQHAMLEKLRERFDAPKNVQRAKALAIMVLGTFGQDEAAHKLNHGHVTLDNRAQVGGSAMRAVGLVVGLTVGGIVAAFLLPIAIDELVAVDTTNWSGGASSLWDIMDVIVVLALFLFFIAVAMGAANRV